MGTDGGRADGGAGAAREGATKAGAAARGVKELKAAALRYDAESDRAPYVVAAGSGYVAQRILQTAVENGVAIYHDDSAATMLAELRAGQQIPPELYRIAVNIYLTLLDVADAEVNGPFRESLAAAMESGGREGEGEEPPNAAESPE
ncbi:MAG: EscU/YscU/HrcU family type III secretion system export apparatus switch protein [Clostridiales Family XIII bacterium]|jgi:flagellar biosynthesis protein|nr:EscU/YscU/HrcU family type III secretion system export apparatus switch protein [Clostridiales Family XIII bacterium]